MRIEEVLWDKERASFCAPKYELGQFLRYDDGLEVIGNIYENPELLEARP